MSEWKEYRLGDIIDVKHGYAFKGECFSDLPTLDILLTPGNFNIGGGFKDGKRKYYNGEYPKSYLLNEGDIIVTMTDLSKEGDTLGYSAKIPKHDKIRFLHNQRIGLLKFKRNDFSKEYIYWLLRSKEYQQFIVNSATGSTVKHTSPSRICEFEFIAPPYNTQNAIAEILSSLDDKIELNNKINQDLENLAQTLFKQWFIDFEFPNENGEPYKSSGGEMVESELGEIPKGWEVGTIYNISEVIYGAPFKSALFNQENKGFPLIRIRDLKTFKPQYWTEENHPKGTKIYTGDLIVGMDAEFRPQIWLGQEAWLNQRLCHFRPKAGFSKLFVREIIRPQLAFFENSSVGTTVIHLGKADIDTFKSIIPSELCLLTFGELSNAIFNDIANNSIENQQLTTLRDTLLPKLISGELEVSQIQTTS
jgi:type I restriction enzyme S subunit